MSNGKSSSLVERAAAVYDFESGLRVDGATLPPPRARLQPVRPVIDEVPAAAVAAPAPVVPQPVVAEPVIAAAPQPAPRPLRRAPATPQLQADIDLARLAAAGLLTPDAPSGGLAEELRLIKRRLLARVDEDEAEGAANARLILIASGQPGDGKTFMALNLALSIAGEADRRVLLIDGDSAKPDICRRLGFEDGTGFVDLLVDAQLEPESLVIGTSIDGLAILPAGRRERNVPELLASNRTDDVLDALLAADPNRIILIDSPPVLAASPAAVLAGHAAQTLVVVRADQTPEAELKEAVDLLSSAPHLSLVLNNAALKIGARRYGRYEEYR